MRLAQQRPTCVFQTGYSLHTLLPHLHVARQVARVVQWRTRRDILRGDVERPLQDLRMQLRLNRDLQVRGGFMAQLTSIALDRQCCELVRTILNAPGIDVRQCDRLLVLLAEHQSKAIDRLLEGNRGEFITYRQALHDLQHRTGSFDPKLMHDIWGLNGDVTSPLACVKIFVDLTGSGTQEHMQKMAKVTARFKGKLLPGAGRAAECFPT